MSKDKELEKIREWVWKDKGIKDHKNRFPVALDINRAIDLTYNKAKQELIKEKRVFECSQCGDLFDTAKELIAHKTLYCMAGQEKK